MPMSYDCLTPLTMTTLAHNQYPSLRMTHPSNSSLLLTRSQQHLNSDGPSSSSTHLHSANVYEEVCPPSDRLQCCGCCSCSLTHYQQQQQLMSTARQITPHYYTCEAPSVSNASTIVCQSCLLETLHRKQQASSTMNCACRHFFVPIK